MMPALFLPLAASLVLAVLVTANHRRLAPKIASRVVAVAIAVLAVAAAPTLWLVALGYVAHLSLFGGRLAWCAHAIGVHDSVPLWIGVPAAGLSLTGVVRSRKVLATYWRLRDDRPGSVEVARHEDPFAFTLPGRGGHVVMSTGLVEMLDEGERNVVLGHERAHAVHRHDRYLLAAQLAAAIVPLLRPLTVRLQFSLERWADEAAVAECGDRQLVARTLGKVAMHGVAPNSVLSFADHGVPARVRALLSPPIGLPRPITVAALWIVAAATTGLAALQLHHLAPLLSSICGRSGMG